MLLVTDGQTNAELTNRDELGSHARELLMRGITASAVGMGARVM